MRLAQGHVAASGRAETQAQESLTLERSEPWLLESEEPECAAGITAP